VVAIVVVSVSVYRSNLFTVRTVDVVGAAHLTPDEVREIAALPTGATLLRFPGTEMTERLEANPWVESAAVTRDFPDTVRIRVVERAPYALVDTAAATLWIVDRDGYVLAEQTPDVAATLVVVRDVEGFEPVLGARTSSEALLNALRVYAGLSDELRARTRAISAPSTDRTALITTDDIEVFVGSSEEIERKDAIARQILLEQEGKVASINVRSVDRPTWRGLDTD
jgi:cell division protein FtsQ